jgi:hypothetical protein
MNGRSLEATPIGVRGILGKFTISCKDFLAMPIVTENYKFPGVYLNHVVGAGACRPGY